MKKLKLKAGVKINEARECSSLGLVYNCPECKVGHTLTHVRTISGIVICNLCKTEYKKP